jgi:two-component system chemotaxis response regulator CheB
VHQPIVVAQHRLAGSEDVTLGRLLQLHTRRLVSDPDDKTPLENDHVYIGPPDYHVLVEERLLVLSTDAPVQFARPSIDVLFASAADAYGDSAIGIVLTGASADGALGLARIKERGGVAIVQDPATSERRAMPDAALALTAADAVLPLEEIPAFVFGLCCEVAA